MDRRGPSVLIVDPRRASSGPTSIRAEGIMKIPSSDNQHAPAPKDLSALSAVHRRTLDALFRHPVAHNLSWKDAIGLFGKLGSVEEKPNHEFEFRLDREQHLMRVPKTRDLTAPQVLELRHLASRSGWSPTSSPKAELDHDPASLGLLAVVDHHEAKIYEVDVTSHDAAAHSIKPYDPHHFLHHLTHKDQYRERGQRAPEEKAYYDEIAQALAAGGKIVLVGDGTGKSSAVRHLAEYLGSHHHPIYQRVVRELSADLAHVTLPQLLAMARDALKIIDPAGPAPAVGAPGAGS
jgi:hypothetical protein